MKIILVECGGWGGIAHYTYNLAQALAQIGSTEVFLLTDSAYELGHLPRHFRLITRPLHNHSYLRAVAAVFSVVASMKPDIVHIQSLFSVRRDWVFFILARFLRIRLIYTAHNILPHERGEAQALFLQTALRFIYTSSSRVIVHGRYAQDKLCTVFGISADKTSVIDHGNYLFARRREASQFEARTQLGLPGEKKVILFFGAIREYKGVDTLIRAFHELCKKNSNTILLIAGKITQTTQPQLYLDLIASLGMDRRIILRDRYVSLEEISVYFSAANVVVFPYREIDSSGALQLAYAFAKPVVASATGAFTECVRDGENGFLVEPGHNSALAAAIEKILANDAQAATMGQRSLQLARERFSWDGIAQKTLQCYLNPR